MPGRKELGRVGEDIACGYLQGLGLVIVDRNWRSRTGEIDIVARGEGLTVFVEVKSRRSLEFGAPEESITIGKRSRLRALAGEYLALKRPGTEVRFDVVSVFFSPDGSDAVTHIPDAF